MTIQTCYETMDLTKYGILQEPCISQDYAYQLTNKKFKKWQARKCGCAQMVDIGVYNTCKHLCAYCYANYQEKKVNENYKDHDPNSTMLIGHLQKEDELLDRKVT